MPRNNYHVISKINGGWKVVRSNAGRATKSFDTQREAIAYGRKLSKERAAELVIHGRDGRLISRETFAPDPKPPRDRT